MELLRIMDVVAVDAVVPRRRPPARLLVFEAGHLERRAVRLLRAPLSLELRGVPRIRRVQAQDAATQEADELACLQWGAEQAGVTKDTKPKDAKAAGDAAAAQVDSAAKGAAVKGAAKGAAVGAIFGSISGNAGAGAGYGAAGGAVAGMRAKKKAGKQAQAQAEQKVSAENQAKLDAVKKGMTACLESKGYTVK